MEAQTSIGSSEEVSHAGAYVVIEAGKTVTLEEARLLSDGTAMNFVSQARGVIFSTTGGEAPDKIKGSLLPYLAGDGLSQYLRVVENNKMRVGEPSPRKSAVQPTSDEAGYQSKMGAIYDDLKRVTRSQPIFQWVGYDTLASSFSMVPDAKITRQIESGSVENRNGHDLTIAFARPSLKKLDALLDMVNWHLKIWKENGVLLVQGVKPETHLYAADSCVDLGYPVLCLTELD